MDLTDQTRPAPPDITKLLHEAARGRDGALNEVMDVVYADLERLARGEMQAQFGPGLPGVTLEPGALVHETFLRLVEQRNEYANRQQFFAIATKVMLRVLMDYHRRRGAGKRGGGQIRLTLSGVARRAADRNAIVEIPEIVEALARLEALDARKADVVKLRALWGFATAETAEILQVSPSTVERDWRFARVWLAAELDGAP